MKKANVILLFLGVSFCSNYIVPLPYTKAEKHYMVKKNKGSQNTQNNNNQLDATAELNQMDPNTNQDSDDQLAQTVLNNFAGIVQSFIQIASNPQNPSVVGSSIAQMLSGLVNVAMEVFKKLPECDSDEQREEYLTILESTLKKGIRTLRLAKSLPTDL